ncbi:synergin gamma [Latimeria chalumnae]|uniref:synergin gamma n=1 Tax=Latimeria chalumnae TaxID=7897 RepID=UPI00313EEB3F
MKRFYMENEMLQCILREIELAWNNLLAFLSLSPSVLQLLPLESCLEKLSEDLKPDLQHEVCGVCLMTMPVKLDAGAGPTEGGLQLEGYSYHMSCANFWLNCVDGQKLPHMEGERERERERDDMCPKHCPHHMERNVMWTPKHCSHHIERDMMSIPHGVKHNVDPHNIILK